MKLFSLIDAMAHAWAHQGITTYEAGCQVITASRELGYPRPLETGIWAQDVPRVLALVARRLSKIVYT